MAQGISRSGTNANEFDEQFEKYIQQHYDDFIRNFKQTVSDASSSQEVKAVIQAIDIYMECSQSLGDLEWRTEHSSYIVLGKRCAAYQSLKNYAVSSDDIGVNREYVLVKFDKLYNLENLQNEYFSDSKIRERNVMSTAPNFVTPDSFMIRWFVTVQDDKTKVRQLVAGVVADLLYQYVNDLKRLKSKQEDLSEWLIIQKWDFMKAYIEELQRQYQDIPRLEHITQASMERYEGRINDAKLYFLNDEKEIDRNNIVYIQKSSRLNNGFEEKRNISGLRKLLETCRDSARCLVATEPKKWVIFGILPDDGCIQNKENCMMIHFKGAEWRLHDGMELILKFKNGRYYINDENNQEKIDEKCKKNGLREDIFGPIMKKYEESVTHGALIIVAEDAKAETKRLCLKYKRGTQIDPITMDKEEKIEMLYGMSCVDGAVLMDYKGRCYGYGVILDGKAVVKGNVGRGSRFNSAETYVFNKRKRKRCAIIVSEDKEKGIKVIGNHR
ncbi:MAG: hypothetical protein J6D08_00185 [Lachnospiraceae bacterium]|nr:hypothetical protein [Lachnospiraceae bacterium]